MRVEHLGVVMEITPQRAAQENTIVRCLKRHKELRQKDVWVRGRGRGWALDEFPAVIDSMVERGIIIRSTTNYSNSFLLRLANRDGRPSRRSAVVELREPLTPQSSVMEER